VKNINQHNCKTKNGTKEIRHMRRRVQEYAKGYMSTIRCKNPAKSTRIFKFCREEKMKLKEKHGTGREKLPSISESLQFAQENGKEENTKTQRAQVSQSSQNYCGCPRIQQQAQKRRRNSQSVRIGMSSEHEDGRDGREQ
jgi:hypothetical protein